MAKKKGLFSKFKKSLSKKSDDISEEIDDDAIELDEFDEQFIEVDEDDNSQILNEREFQGENTGIFAKIKSKISKSDVVDDEEFEDEDEYIDDADDQGIEETATNTAEKDSGFFSKVKSKLSRNDKENQEEIHEEIEELEGDDESGPIELNADSEDEQEAASQETKTVQIIADSTNTEIKVNVPQDLTSIENSLDTLEELNQEEQAEQNLETNNISNDIIEEVDTEDEYEEDLAPPPKNLRLKAIDNLVAKFKNREAGKRAFNLAPKANGKSKTSSSGSEQLILSILGKDGRAKTHKVFIYALSLTLFYNVGKFTGLFLGKEKPQAPQSNFSRPKTYNPRKDIAAIERNNIFNALESEEEKVVKDEPKKTTEPEIKVCLTAQSKSRLSLKLLHTVVLQDTVKSVASVSKRGKILNIREGERIDNLAEIGRIENKRIIFKNLSSKKCEYIASEKDKKALFPEPKIVSAKEGKKLTKKSNRDNIQVEGNKFKIKKSLRDELLSNVGEILTQARAVPIKNPDGTLSFKMTEVVPGSIFSQLNIKNGDIVTGLNGRKIKNMNELMSMFGKIKQNNNYEITIKRDGAEQNLNYNFTD